MSTVIVVDDELVARMDFAQMTEEMGMKVIGLAQDGFDAVELCKQRRPDIVLMDLSMPIFDGFSAGERIIRENLAGSVIVITAYSDEKTIGRAVEAGVRGYLVKPVQKHSLYSAIQLALAQRTREDALTEKIRAAEKIVEEQKLIDRAKAKLASAEGISEAEAYRQLQKLAMDKRCTMGMIATRILDQPDDSGPVARAKKLVMEKYGYSESKAYKRITALAQERGCSLTQAALLLTEDKSI